MTAVLLDTNVLVALMWPAHEFHIQVQQWFERNARRGWATCPFTQTGFVRVASNPAVSRDALTPQQALQLLNANLRHRFHRFWEADLSLEEAVEPFRQRLMGHRQVTDAYLLGLAIHKVGKLATLDRALLAWLPEDSSERDRIEMILSDSRHE